MRVGVAFKPPVECIHLTRTPCCNQFARGATTAPALLAFLKAQAAKDKKGPALDEMVELAAALVPTGSKRAFLLTSYQSVAGCVHGGFCGKLLHA